MAGLGTTVEKDFVVAMGGTALEVSPTFSVDGTAKTVSITLAEGLAFSDLPGMVEDETMGWKYSQAKVDASQYEGYIEDAVFSRATGTANPYITPGAGTVTYTMVAGAKSVPALVAQVVADRPYMFFVGSIAISNAINITRSETVGVTPTSDTEVLETYDITSPDAAPIFKFTTQINKNLALQPGQSWSITPIGFAFRHGDAGTELSPSSGLWFGSYPETNSFIGNPYPVAYKTATVTLKIPSYFGVSETVAIAGGYYWKQGVTSSIVKSEGGYDYLQITVDGTTADVGYQAFVLSGTALPQAQIPGAAIGTAVDLFSVDSSSYTTFWNQKKDNTATIAYNVSAKIVDPALAGKVTLRTPSLHANTTSTVNIGTLADLTPLSSLSLINESGATIENLRIRFDYDSTNTGFVETKAVQIMTNGGAAKDIVLTTSLGREIPIEGQKNNYYLIAPSLASGEYVTRCEYTVLRIPNNGLIEPNGHSFSVYQAYGSILPDAADGGTYATTVSVLKNTASVGAPAVYEVDYSKSSNVTISKSVGAITYHAVTTLGGITNLAAGDTTELNMAFGMDKYRQNNYAPWSTKGFALYVREPEGVTYDESSFVLSAQGSTWKVSDSSLSYSLSDDKDGRKVYVFNLPDLVLGSMKSDGTIYDDVKITVNASIDQDSPSKTIPLSELFMFDDSSIDGFGAYTANGGVNDQFEVTDRPSGYKIMVPSGGQVLAVSAAPAFLVKTAADRGDNAWATYNATADTGTINLNTQQEARYKIEAINNLGKEATGQYNVIIPVPKKDESFPNHANGTAFQTDPFGWSVSLAQDSAKSTYTAMNASGLAGLAGDETYDPDNVISKFTISYSTKYTNDLADDSWTTWGAIPNKNDIKSIRMVRESGVFANGAHENFLIPFDLPQGDDARDWAGNVNTYSVLVDLNMGADGSVLKKSLPVKLVLRTGLAQGVVKIDDVVGNGGMSGVAYLQDTSSVVESQTVASNGTFTFAGLDETQNVDLVFTNAYAPASGQPVRSTNLQFVTPQTGWTIEANHSKATYENLTPSSAIAKSLELKLITPKTITFNSGTGASTVAPQYAFAGDDVADTTLVTPTKLGYDFGGWYTDEDDFSDGKKWTFGQDDIADDQQLYAKWTAKTVNLIFDENHGTFTGTKPADAKYDGTITEPEKEPKRSGYNFTGWKAGDIDAWDFTNGTGTKVTVGNGVSGANGISPSLTLVAQWSDPIQYGITYNNLVGSSWSGDIHPDTYTVESNDITISKPTKTGYTFEGWTATGGITYAIPQETIVIPKGTTVAISLNAVWEVNTEDAYWNIVDFDDNGSDSGEITNELYVAPTKKISEAEKGTFPSDPTKTHYIFDGWKVSGTNTKYDTSAAAKEAVPADDITLVAQWKVNTVDTIYWNTVAFDDNDSTSGAISEILYVAPDKKISQAEKGSFPDDPEKDHYVFDGWKVSGTNTKYATSSDAKNAVPTSDITLVAQWKVDTTNTEYWAKVTFDTNGGSAAPAPVYVSYGNDNPAIDGTWPSDPTRDGYTFSGWFDGESQYIASTILTIKADTTVVAKWTVNASDPVWATVSFDANGGTGAPSAILYNTSEKKLADGVSFPNAKPNLSGYTFANWNTKANGNGSIVNADNLAPSSNITLYAIYNANGNTAYKVEHYHVDALGSASLKETSNHTAKTDTTANATAKTYEHYTLNSAHGSAVASGNVAGDGSLVLKLYYGINHNTVSYSVTGTVPEGAPTAPAASDVAYGQTVNVASALAFDGYTFSGWTAEGVSGASFTMPDSDVAFTGSWTLVDNGGGDNGDGDNGGGNDGGDGNTVVDKPNEPKADTPKPATTNTKVTRTPAPAAPATAQATIAAAAAEQGIPTFGIGGNDIPLVAPFGVDSWSLANLLFMLAALVFAIYTTIAVARRRKYVYEMGEDSSANPRYGLFAITIAMAIASVVLFFTTQDLTQGMALVDVVSPEFVVALAVNVIAAKKVLPKIDGSLI